MINQIRQEAEARMQKSITSLGQELIKLRTGRAHPSLLEQINVSYYGSTMPLNQVSNISVGDARTLMVTPWEKTMVPEIEKAIRSAGLGLNPATSGQVIRIPLPPLTEERRKELVKIVKQEGENAKVAVRNIRRDANNQFKDLLKDKSISEDEERSAQETMQKSTDKFIAEIEKILANKEAEVMEV